MQQRCAKLLLLIPAVTPTLKLDKLQAMLEELADFLLNRSACPDSYILKDEAKRYQRQWSKVDQLMHPADLRGALKQCDKDSYPNLPTLLCIGCTLPVTTAESERANSVIKLVKTALWNWTGEEQLSSLVMLKVHGTKHLNVHCITEVFCTMKPQRLLSSIATCFQT